MFLMPFVLSVGLALIPSLLILRYFYRRDEKKEPRGLLIRIFFFGILSIIPAAIIEILVSSLDVFTIPLRSMIFEAFIVAGLVEEGCKLFVVRKYACPNPAFDEVSDGIMYAITASLGFAFLENLLYSIGEGNGISILLIRAVTSVPLHASASGIMGYYVGLSKIKGKNLYGFGLFMGVMIHGFYDFFLFTGNGFLALGALAIVVVSFLYLVRLFKKAQRMDAEADLGWPHQWAGPDQ